MYGESGVDFSVTIIMYICMLKNTLEIFKIIILQVENKLQFIFCNALK